MNVYLNTLNDHLRWGLNSNYSPKRRDFKFTFRLKYIRETLRCTEAGVISSNKPRYSAPRTALKV